MHSAFVRPEPWSVPRQSYSIRVPADPLELDSCETPERHAPETMAGGVAVFDYNNDGKLDIFFTNGADIRTLRKSSPKYSNRLFENDGKDISRMLPRRRALPAVATISVSPSPIMTTTGMKTSLSPGFTKTRFTTTMATARSQMSRPKPDSISPIPSMARSGQSGRSGWM